MKLNGKALVCVFEPKEGLEYRESIPCLVQGEADDASA